MQKKWKIKKFWLDLKGQKVKKWDTLLWKNSAATAIVKMKHTIASKFCINIVDVWCSCFPFYGPPCRHWIFFPDGISWNFDIFLLFCLILTENEHKRYVTYKMKHSIFIISHFQFENWIRKAYNINWGVLQRSVLGCPRASIYRLNLLALTGFLTFLGLILI